MEVTIGQSKARQSAEQYLNIEQNTQYLTHLVRYSNNKRKVYLRQDINPDLRSIAALTVQLSYLLFTCCVKQVSLFISKRFMILNPVRRQLNPEICCEYILQKDFLTLRQQEQKFIHQTFEKHEFSISDMRAYGKYTLNYVKTMLEMVKAQIQRLKSSADKNLAKQFVQLEVIKNYLQVRLPSIQHPRIVILSFEQSEIFRQYSILVKVMNNSIFSTIKNNKVKNIFSQICALESSLLKSREKNNSFHQVYSLDVQLAIQQFLRLLIKYQVVRVEQSLYNTAEKPNSSSQNPPSEAGVSGSNNNIAPGPALIVPQSQSNIPNANFLNESSKPTKEPPKPYTLGDVDDMENLNRKYFCKVQVHQKPWRPFTPKVYQNLKFQALNNYNTSDKKVQDQNEVKQPKDVKGPPNSLRNEFVVEFTAAKGLLVVKYLSQIQMSIENTDFVMFQCNNIAYHWSQVSMQLMEKSVNKTNKKKERFLALKTITHLHMADRPLFKLLLMFDLVMLCAKLAEPELKKSIMKGDDYYRVQQISLKVNHMINLFIKKIERYYKILAQSEYQKIR